MKGNEPVAPEGGDTRSQAVRGCRARRKLRVCAAPEELARHKREEPVCATWSAATWRSYSPCSS